MQFGTLKYGYVGLQAGLFLPLLLLLGNFTTAGLEVGLIRLLAVFIGGAIAVVVSNLAWPELLNKREIC